MAPSDRRPHPLLFAVMGIVVGVVFGVLAYRVRSRDEALREHGRQADAR